MANKTEAASNKRNANGGSSGHTTSRSTSTFRGVTLHCRTVSWNSSLSTIICYSPAAIFPSAIFAPNLGDTQCLILSLLDDNYREDGRHTYGRRVNRCAQRKTEIRIGTLKLFSMLRRLSR